MRSFDLKYVGSTALVAVFAFAAAGDANAQRNRGKNNNAERGNRANTVKMQNRGQNRPDRSAARTERSARQDHNNRQRQNNGAARQAQRNDHNGWNRGQQRQPAQTQPQRINRTVRQPQRVNSGWDNVRRNDNIRRDREPREAQIRRDRSNDRRDVYRGNDRSYRRPQIIIPAQTQKRYPQRYGTDRRGNSWENEAWRNARNRERRENYYAPLRNRNDRRDRNRGRGRYESYSPRPAAWTYPARTGRSWGMYNRSRNLFASYYRMERRNDRKAYKRAQKQRERYWREVRKNERRYQRYLARVYRDRYYARSYYLPYYQPYSAYYQPYTTIRYSYVTRPQRIYYPRTYTAYNSYPSGYYYDDDRYDPYYQQSYYDPYYDDDDGINWTSVILQTALSAFLPDSGFDSIVPVNNYAYEPGYSYTPVSYSYGAAQPYYATYSPTVYPESMVENAYQRGYQEGFRAGQNSAYYNDPYVMQNGSYYPYSVSLSQQRELLSEGYERGYTDAMNGNDGYYDNGYSGSGDLVGILLDNVLTLG